MRSLLCITVLLVVRLTVQQNDSTAHVTCTEPNEEWTPCASRCGEACADQGRTIMCPKICRLSGGCSCKEGYARDSNGQCIPKIQCPPNNSTITCGPDEEYLICGSACPPQCGDELMGACIKMCKRGCFCKNGLVRNSADNRCISRSECQTNNAAVSRCARMICLPGTACEEDENGARCARRGKITCANLRCAGPCENTLYGPRCRPQNANKPGSCPQPGIGICIDECQSDANCEGSQKCCSNGCGRNCMDAVNLIAQ